MVSGWDAAFATPPPRWGLRGDPLLWDELRATLATAPTPVDPAEATAMLRMAWESLTATDLTGHGLDGNDAVFVARLNRGGMSGGHVAPVFWRETAFPLLVARLFPPLPDA